MTIERVFPMASVYVHADNPNVVTVPALPANRLRPGYPVLHQARERDRGVAMSEYLAIYERNGDGWWAYLPDLPGCTATGHDRDEVETKRSGGRSGARRTPSFDWARRTRPDDSRRESDRPLATADLRTIRHRVD